MWFKWGWGGMIPLELTFQWVDPGKSFHRVKHSKFGPIEPMCNADTQLLRLLDTRDQLGKQLGFPFWAKVEGVPESCHFAA